MSVNISSLKTGNALLYMDMSVPALFCGSAASRNDFALESISAPEALLPIMLSRLHRNAVADIKPFSALYSLSLYPEPVRMMGRGLITEAVFLRDLMYSIARVLLGVNMPCVPPQLINACSQAAGKDMPDEMHVFNVCLKTGGSFSNIPAALSSREISLFSAPNTR